MTRARRRGFPWFQLALAVFIIAAAGALYYYRWGPGSVPVVAAARVVRGDLRAELSATGVVKAHQVEIASEAPARIERIAVRENDQVRRGQLLVVLDRASLEGYLRQAQAEWSSAQALARQAEQAVAAERANARGAIAAAEANLRAARAQLERLERGSRPQEIRAAEAQVEQAQAQLEQAEADLARLQALHADGAVSAQALDQARTAREVAAAQLRAAQQALRLTQEGARAEDVEAARAQVAAAQATLEQARALERVVQLREGEAQAARAQAQAARAQVAVAQAELKKAEIRSPLDATVVRVDARPGEVAYPGVALMVLSDLSRMWVEAEIDDVDLDKVRVGQEVSVHAEALAGRALRGVVYEVSRAAEPKLMGRVRAKIVRAKVRLLEPAPLTAEMEVDVESRPLVARGALLVPNQAVQREGGSDYVFVIEGDRARRRHVLLGRRNYEQTQVVAGLREGEVAALPGDRQLHNGQRVRARM